MGRSPRKTPRSAFAQSLIGYEAEDILIAFPGIPTSTVYDWLAGNAEPPLYLQPTLKAAIKHGASLRKLK